ncbi:MAG: hypothetical protein M3O15_04995 [Acidobacteriota bacterium]|nr:hypothetical protein [Acidobacteriota bacterium]
MDGAVDTGPGIRTPRVFVLSPASTAGERSRQLAAPRASFELAQRFQSPEGVPIAEAFRFMSALYFRGKIAYAERFASPPAGALDDGILVIAPGYGLVHPGWRLTRERMARLRETAVDLRVPGYTGPLAETARDLERRLSQDTRVVLLGSIATGKYLDVLAPVLGDRLLFPTVFAGTGDMRRGSLMLQAVREDQELAYEPVSSIRASASVKLAVKGVAAPRLPGRAPGRRRQEPKAPLGSK